MPSRLPPLPPLLLVGALTLAMACANEAPERPLARAQATTTSTAVAATTSTTEAPIDVNALVPPAPATDAPGLARQIAEAEAAVRDPAATDPTVAVAALAQQVAYRQLGMHPEWEAEVLAGLPDDLRRDAQLNAAARREFQALRTTVATDLPAWRIEPPAPADTLLAAYREAESTFGIPWQYLAAINLVETGLGRIRGTSTAGAQGPMQFMPATWAAYGAGGDINDPHDAIMGAARYLAANNGVADIDQALYRYNHNDHYVLGVRLYADLIAASPRAFLAYYHWGIWYVTDQGDIYLPVGYSEPSPVPVEEYLARS